MTSRTARARSRSSWGILAGAAAVHEAGAQQEQNDSQLGVEGRTRLPPESRQRQRLGLQHDADVTIWRYELLNRCDVQLPARANDEGLAQG